MRARARHVPALLGLLAVGLAASSIVALFSGVVLGDGGGAWLVGLWLCAGIAAALTLLLGLLLDRRGVSIPLALLALVTMAIAVLLVLPGLGGS